MEMDANSSLLAHKLASLRAAQPADYSLQQAYYNDADVYRADIERIFSRHWLVAGHASSAPTPGDYFLYEMDGESVIIIRGADDQIRAFANVCRHRGSRICSKTQGHATVLVCPYHAWAYNLDGSIRSARMMGPEFDAKSFALKPVHVRVVEGLVLISFAEKPLDLAPVEAAIRGAFGPYGWATAKVAARETYAMRCNWKLAVENYVECYHCGPSHKEYSQLHALEQPLWEIEALNAAMERRTCDLGVKIASIDQRVPSTSGQAPIFIFRYALYEGVQTGSEGGAMLAPPMGAFSASDGGVTTCHFAPASFFIAYADHGVIYRFMPTGPATCAMELIWLVRADAREGIDYDLAKLTWLWRVTSLADKRITEDNQIGVNSRYYEPGPYAPMEPNAKNYVSWYLGEVSRA